MAGSKKASPLPRGGTGEPSDDTMADEAEIIALARHDPRAFTPLYARYAEPVYRYAYRRLHDHDAAADATSQIFLKALARLGQYRGGSFRAWLFTIAANVVVDVQRRRRPVMSLDRESGTVSLMDTAPGPEELTLAVESAQSVTVLLAQLTSEQREIVALRLAGLTGVEIAEVLDKSVTAVRSSQFRAYARLRQLVNQSASKEGAIHDP